MVEGKYWVGFKINEEGCAWVLEGPFQTYDEAMERRERMKVMHTPLKEIVSTPILANSEEEALEKVRIRGI